MIAIVSGGQTGVDQAALRAAQALGLRGGGWCPPGRACESGTIPVQFEMIETPSERSALAPEVARSQRTEWNVRDADATLIVAPGGVPVKYYPMDVQLMLVESMLVAFVQGPPTSKPAEPVAYQSERARRWKERHVG